MLVVKCNKLIDKIQSVLDKKVGGIVRLFLDISF
ncbi:hypothetical protein FHT22_001396 [Pedobacter sp. SG918]|nr:hypothetical protein [Pedobacter sp. SG918]